MTGDTSCLFSEGEYRSGQSRCYLRDHLGSVGAVTGNNDTVLAACA